MELKDIISDRELFSRIIHTAIDNSIEQQNKVIQEAEQMATSSFDKTFKADVGDLLEENARLRGIISALVDAVDSNYECFYVRLTDAYMNATEE